MAVPYPKMLTVTLGSGKIVPAVYPAGHVKQGTFVIFNSQADEAGYDGTGVAMSTATGVIENKHHS
jgi:hypothetical protein